MAVTRVNQGEFVEVWGREFRVYSLQFDFLVIC